MRKVLSIFLICTGFISCTPGIYPCLGRLAEAPEISLPHVASFTKMNAIHITWEEDTRADEYIVYRCRDIFYPNFTVVYQGCGLEYLDTECGQDERYLYRLSKRRGEQEFGPSEPVLGVCSAITGDFFEPNNTKAKAAWMEYDIVGNLQYYRDAQKNVLQDEDWYYIEVLPRRIANIVITQLNLESPQTYLYFARESMDRSRLPIMPPFPLKIILT